MIENNKIYNEDCRDTMSKMRNGQVDIILSSPFYNTNDKAGGKRTLNNCKLKEGHYPFIGTGTTAVACKRMKLNFIGSDISPKQVQYSLERLLKEN